MKRTTFNIRQASGGLLAKQGYIFRLPYPKRALFAVAKEDHNIINSYRRWVVSEMSSGLAVAFGKWGGTRKAAMAQAAKAVRKYGAKKMKHEANKAIAEQGRAN